MATVGTLLVVAIVFCNVIARYLFNTPFHWAEEVTSITVILIGFFPAAALLRKGWHVKFDLVSDRIESRLPRVSNALQILVNLCGIAFAGIIVWQTGINILNSWKFNMREPSMLGTPLWVPYSYMLIGSILLLIAFSCQLFDNISQIKGARKSES